jgi:ribosome-binding protein aMBF1 (putative translation factor)
MVSALARKPCAGDNLRAPTRGEDMPVCKSCGNEADELLTVKVSGRSKKVCEDCADRAREESEVAEASESVVQGMMGFKGRR